MYVWVFVCVNACTNVSWKGGRGWGRKSVAVNIAWRRSVVAVAVVLAAAAAAALDDSRAPRTLVASPAAARQSRLGL